MANHKVVGAWRGSPIFEGADFLVCAANPNVEDTKFHLVGFCNAGSFMLDDPDLSGSWKNCNCFHLFDGSFIESNCAPSPISSLSLYFTSLCGCTRLNRIGGKEECGDQANARDDDKRNEGQGVGLNFRDE